MRGNHNSKPQPGKTLTQEERLCLQAGEQSPLRTLGSFKNLEHRLGSFKLLSLTLNPTSLVPEWSTPPHFYRRPHCAHLTLASCPHPTLLSCSETSPCCPNCSRLPAMIARQDSGQVQESQAAWHEPGGLSQMPFLPKCHHSSRGVVNITTRPHSKTDNLRVHSLPRTMPTSTPSVHTGSKQQPWLPALQSLLQGGVPRVSHHTQALPTPRASALEWVPSGSEPREPQGTFWSL